MLSRRRIWVAGTLAIAAACCLVLLRVAPAPAPVSAQVPTGISAARCSTNTTSPAGRCVGPLPDRREIPGAPARYVDQTRAYDRDTVRRTQEHTGDHGWRPFPDYDNANDWIALANLPDIPCSCPAMPAFECAVWDRQIAHDLAPWINVSLPREVFDQPFESYKLGTIPYFLRVDQNDVIHLRAKGETNAYYATFARMIAELNRYNTAIPVTYFAGHLWDYPKIPNQDPIPVFGQMKSIDQSDILVPLWETSGYPGIQCSGALADRVPKVYFLGRCTGPVMGFYTRMLPYYRRYRIGRLEQQYPDVIHGGIVHDDRCVTRFNNEDAKMDLAILGQQQNTKRREEQFSDTCRFRYVLVIDGNTASHRLKYLLRANIVVFLQQSVFYEFYHFLLRPYVHYVPVSANFENLVEQVHWANAHPAEVAAIARNARTLAERYLTYENHLCYMHRVLQFLALKQPLVE